MLVVCSRGSCSSSTEPSGFLLEQLEVRGPGNSTWSLDHDESCRGSFNEHGRHAGVRQLTGGVQAFNAMSNELDTLRCGLSDDKERHPSDGFCRDGNENLSYFVGLMRMNHARKPSQRRPQYRRGVTEGLCLSSARQMLRRGRVISRPVRNICLDDGSVQKVTASGFPTVPGSAGTQTNPVIALPSRMATDKVSAAR